MRNVLAALGLAALTFGLQWYVAGGNAEFSLYADEPAHYVTGLMFTEYIRQGFPVSPIRFAEQYYVHYPKVAIGSWPPLFYVEQALWSLPFGSSKTSLYVLMAATMSALAIWIFVLTRRTLGTAGALLLGVTFILMPVTQDLLPMMMADSLVTLLTLTSTLCFARFWEKGRYRDAALYGLFAGATVLTKGSGVSLTLIPVFAILLSGRWKMVLSKPLWLAAAIVGLLGGPWTYFTLHIVQDGWQSDASILPYMIDALWRVPWWHVANLTIPVAGMVLLGGWVMTRKENRPNSALLISAASTVLAVLFFHVLTPVGMEHRRIFMAVPQSLVIAAFGIAWFEKRLPARMRLVPVMALALFAAVLTMLPEKKPHYGYEELAKYLHGRSDWSDCVTLVSSENHGEGLLISEMAALEHIPRRYILRAGKMLATMSWNATEYKLGVKDAKELAEYLERSPVNLVALDDYPGFLVYPHHQLLWRVLPHSPQWEKVSGFQGKNMRGAISLYRHRTKACQANPAIEVDLTRKIQRSVSN